MKKIILILFILFPFLSFSQLISGTVYSNDAGEKQVLPGVNIVWQGTSEGTASQADGSFELKKKSSQHMLVFSFVGYESKTVHISGVDPIEIVLQRNLEIEEVRVVKKNRGTYLSTINPIQTENIGGAELHKAACCNLAESFETNPSVDVSYSDAVTGAKQIRLLGLDGTYSLLNVENMPSLRGLATTFGLTYIPGPWLESIQVSKGAASVLNGTESMAGQINAELKKPDAEERLFLNLYTNSEQRYEFNANSSHRLNDNLTTGIFVHGHDRSKKTDHNNDGFLDEPISDMFQIGNRWKFNNQKGYMAQAYVNLLWEDRLGGQVDASHDMDPVTGGPYGVSIKNKRIDAFFKTGYVWPNGNTAIAWLSNFSKHETESFYGINPYNADETRFHGRLILTTDVDKAGIHSFNTGASFDYDEFDEMLNEVCADYFHEHYDSCGFRQVVDRENGEVRYVKN